MVHFRQIFHELLTLRDGHEGTAAAEKGSVRSKAGNHGTDATGIGIPISHARPVAGFARSPVRPFASAATCPLLRLGEIALAISMSSTWPLRNVKAGIAFQPPMAGPQVGRNRQQKVAAECMAHDRRNPAGYCLQTSATPTTNGLTRQRALRNPLRSDVSRDANAASPVIGFFARQSISGCHARSRRTPQRLAPRQILAVASTLPASLFWILRTHRIDIQQIHIQLS